MFSLALFIQTVFGQFDVEFQAGYVGIANDDIDNHFSLIYQSISPNDNIAAPEKTVGTWTVGATIKNKTPIYYGLALHFNYSGTDFEFETNRNKRIEEFTMNTLEVRAIAGSEFFTRSVISPFIEFYGGWGYSSITQTISDKNYVFSNENINIEHSSSATYFSGMLLGGVSTDIGSVSLRIAGGYRMANAGEPEGELIYNGTSLGTRKLEDTNGDPISIDMSGVVAMIGIVYGF